MTKDVQSRSWKPNSYPKVEARQSADACNTFESHPDGVWMLTVRSVFEDQHRTIRMYLDATTGKQLCGEEIISNAAPWPTLPPHTTATPVLPSVLQSPLTVYRLTTHLTQICCAGADPDRATGERMLDIYQHSYYAFGLTTQLACRSDEAPMSHIDYRFLPIHLPT